MKRRKHHQSKRMWKSALRHLPGGVNSPVRAFAGVGGTPLFVSRGKGSKIWDVDGNWYIDYIGSWGPLILGHADPDVVRAVREAAGRGTSFGIPTDQETELARLVKSYFPSIEKIRFVNSGTEASMSAIRLARGYTGRDEIVKFEGCYHGHVDALLVKAGSGATTLGIPTSPGVPSDFTRHTRLLPYNDPRAVRKAFQRYGRRIAGVIVEPVAGNMGVIRGTPEFLETLREETRNHDSLLIFDEVMSGFRVSRGGAQELAKIKPDLTVLGKVLGGGMPIGAFGGSVEIMRSLAPEGPVYQAGTLSGNPMAVAGGLATLKKLKDRKQYKRLEKLSLNLAEGLKEASQRQGITTYQNRVGSMMTLFFCAGPVTDYASALSSDTSRYARFFHSMLDRGIYLAPSQFEAAFVSLAHTERDIGNTVAAAEEAFREIK